jgi:hypothetical protein
VRQMIDRRNTLTGLLGTALVGSASPILAKPAPAPSNFGGRNNYRIATVQDCGDLLRLSVTIEVTEDIVVKPTNPQNGFNFQLNCYSNEPRAAWQQYVVGLQGTDLHGKFQNFRSRGPNAKMVSMAKPQFPLLSLPNLTLPAGYRITMALSNDAGHDITGVEFTVAKGSNTLKHQQVTLTQNGLTEADLAPIVAFELVLVGPAGGHTAVLKSGGGAFDFSAAAPMAAGTTFPSCTAHPNGTAEQSNSTYGALPARPGASFTQTFGVS